MKLNYLSIFFAAFILLTSCKKKENKTADPVTPVPVTPTPTVAPTNTALPSLTSLAITAITDSSAVSGGSVTLEGASVITAVGVCWDEQPSPTLLKSKTFDGAGTGSYTSKLANLKSNTTYYMRAYATNLSGTAYGNEITFKTAKSTKWVGWGNGVTNSDIRQFLTSGSDLFMSTGGGILKSPNGQNNWSMVNSGINNTNVSSLVAKNNGIFAGTTGDGIYFSNNGGTSWTQMNSGLTDLYCLELVSNGNNLFNVTSSEVFLSTNNSSSWTNVTPPVSFPMIEQITTVGTTVFVLDKNSGKIYISTNNGTTWNFIPDINPAENIIDIIGIESDLYACTYGGLYKTSNNGTTWTKMDGGLGNYPVYTVYKDNNTLYAGGPGTVYRSTDNGTTWSSLGYGLGFKSVTAIQVFQGGIYAGLQPSGGVFRLDVN